MIWPGLGRAFRKARVPHAIFACATRGLNARIIMPGPPSPTNEMPSCASQSLLARTLNATGQSRVTLSLRLDQFKSSLLATAGRKGAEIRPVARDGVFKPRRARGRRWARPTYSRPSRCTANREPAPPPPPTSCCCTGAPCFGPFSLFFGGDTRAKAGCLSARFGSVRVDHLARLQGHEKANRSGWISEFPNV